MIKDTDVLTGAKHVMGRWFFEELMNEKNERVEEVTVVPKYWKRSVLVQNF